MINAEGKGIVKYVDAEKIIIKDDKNELEELVSFDESEKNII